MRKGLMGIGSAILLGGAVGVGLLAGQETAKQSAENGAETAAVSPPVAASTYAITPEAIDCTTFVSQHECRTTIFVRPSASAPDRELTLKAMLVTADGNAVDLGLMAECSTHCSNDIVRLGSEPVNSVRITLKLPSEWRRISSPQVGSGFLGIVSDKNPHRFEGTPKRLRVLAPSPSNWQWAVILGPGIVAFLIASSVIRNLAAAKIRLDYRMGAPSWKASESWSSNLTVGAGLVNAVMTLAVATDFTVFMTKPSYGALTMLLGALVVLAPIVYGISRHKVSVSTSPLDPPVFEGAVSVFLVAGALTLWASAGQLLTFSLLIGEVWRAGALSGVVAAVIAVLTLGVLYALLNYGHSSMLEAAMEAKEPGKKVTGGREARTGTERAPAWSLL